VESSTEVAYGSVTQRIATAAGRRAGQHAPHAVHAGWQGLRCAAQHERWSVQRCTAAPAGPHLPSSRMVTQPVARSSSTNTSAARSAPTAEAHQTRRVCIASQLRGAHRPAAPAHRAPHKGSRWMPHCKADVPLPWAAPAAAGTACAGARGAHLSQSLPALRRSRCPVSRRLGDGAPAAPCCRYTCLAACAPAPALQAPVAAGVKGVE
jgi:hypothetical protein